VIVDGEVYVSDDSRDLDIGEEVKIWERTTEPLRVIERLFVGAVDSVTLDMEETVDLMVGVLDFVLSRGANISAT
jgi:hypothetical protein